MPRNKSTKSNVKAKESAFTPNKELHLEKSESFCMAPWIHIHTSPNGIAAPCCISTSCGHHAGVGNARTQSLMTIVNSPKMNQLRLDMLNGIKNNECVKCHDHEANGVKSSRNMLNEEFMSSYEEAITTTNKDGSLDNFKMRYFDIRFSNICNFKCRTCGSGFSTMWEQEDLKNRVFNARIIPKNDNEDFLNDVLKQIEHMETAYFAGGEPLITEEHYILLEEMIRLGKTNIKLRYNTNMSNLKFKDKDLLQLWKHFKNRIDIYASIDHYGERAEYIRHGTDWGVVESNFIKAKQTPYLNIQINTVLSVFNYLTLKDFYSYLLEKKLYTPKDSIYTLYSMSTPEILAAHILPTHLKEKGKENMSKLIEIYKSVGFRDDAVQQLEVATPWVFSQDTWHEHKFAFIKEVKRVDQIRGENFVDVFPELRDMFDQRKIRFPV